MRKYTFVFKKKVVSDYLNNEGGYKYLAHKYQINRTLVRHWVRIYNYHGWEGLVGGGKSYTTKFKLDVIEYMETNGLSIQETAKKFNIGSSSLALLELIDYIINSLYSTSHSVSDFNRLIMLKII
ncbi:hypothetical protein EfmAA818_03860 [Enterococcus faecium]|nr:hypothetical protein EfmAA818_03860 [Enterococcus faecium]